MQKDLYFFIFVLTFLCSCATKKLHFDEAIIPPIPDYSKIENWAAHPDKRDSSDVNIPNDNPMDVDDKQVDVFFVYPTSYTGKRDKYFWNASVYDAKINKKTDEGAIQYQASVLNNIGRIYAPRYRQAHLQAYFTEDVASGYKALDLAYSDVKAAFEFYLKNYNQGRPIIIISHSQGTTHAARLIKDYFDGKLLANKLVVAYLPGIPVYKNNYKNITACKDSTQTGCICSWRTFKKNHENPQNDKQIIITNPINWKDDFTYATKEQSLGGLLPAMKYHPHIADAQIHKSVIWVTKPKFKWSFLIWTPNYHVGDINLYYYDIRHNAKMRIGYFWK
jgi:Protein of unknown function (DUF3089)